MAAAGWHYGVQITSCVPADPVSKGGSEATVKIAKADLAPTWRTCAVTTPASLSCAPRRPCGATPSTPGRNRRTRRPPIDMLAEERARLHPVPTDPYVAALGETRVVTRESVISLGETRYSVPHQLIDQTVFVRVDGDEVIIAPRAATASPRSPATGHRRPANRNSPTSTTRPGGPHGSSTSAEATHSRGSGVPRAAAGRSGVAGQGRGGWHREGPGEDGLGGRVRRRPRQQEVDAALAVAAGAGRFAEADLASVLRHRRRTGAPARVVVPIAEGHSLQPGTSRWQEVGR